MLETKCFSHEITENSTDFMKSLVSQVYCDIKQPLDFSSQLQQMKTDRFPIKGEASRRGWVVVRCETSQFVTAAANQNALS